MKTLTILTAFSILAAVSACSSSDDADKNNETANNRRAVNSSKEVLIHENVTRLANRLFSSAKNINLSQAVAVGTFLPINLTNPSNLAGQKIIGLQIQESLITLAAQAGLKVIEFKTASSIKITENADVMLSRNIEHLHNETSAQYFLTGTYAEYDNKLMVNARIIELSSNQVIAAATDYIAMPSQRDQQKVIIKNDMLYRTTY